MNSFYRLNDWWINTGWIGLSSGELTLGEWPFRWNDLLLQRAYYVVTNLNNTKVRSKETSPKHSVTRANPLAFPQLNRLALYQHETNEGTNYPSCRLKEDLAAGREKEGEFVQFHLWYFYLIKVSDVPQASVLGALLFSIYVNDLPNVSQNCSTAHYVDDTKLLLSFTENSSVHVIESVISNLQWIHNWCFDNCLMLNPDKTWLMVFGSQQMCSKLLDF